MSKIGKMLIKLNNVTAQKDGKTLRVTGSKGTLVIEIPSVIDVNMTDEQISFVLKDPLAPNGSALWGLTRALVNNAVTGVSTGFVRELELVGVGYRVEKQGADLRIMIGYSHPVIVKAPQGIAFEVEGNNFIKVLGSDRGLVGQVAANIRAIRRPEPYKGKGIKYKDEIVKRKQGKAAK